MAERPIHLDFNSARRCESVVRHVAGISSRCRLEQDDLGLFLRNGAMFDAPWHNQKLTWPQLNRAIAKLHAHPTAPDEKHFVGVLVMMPEKFTFELYDLHFLPIQFAHDLRPPMLREGRKLFRQIDFFHPVKQ